MSEKVFYQTRYIEVFNDIKMVNITSDLHYGELPDTYNEITVNNYEDFLSALKSRKIISNEFFVDSKCFSKKEFIYTCSWYERFKLKPKEFSSYSQITTVEKCEPTINSVLENLPANELVQWLKDVGVLSSNSSISDVKVLNEKINVIKSHDLKLKED